MRQSKKKALQITALLLALILCAGSVVPVRAAETKKQVVRVPYGFNDFLHVDRGGKVTGFYADYLEKLAEVNNWKYEYVETTWTEAVEMLEEGKIDLLYPVNYSKKREKTMDYAAMPIGYTAPGIFALKDSGFDYEDYENFNEARVAVGKNSSNEKALEKFAKEKHFTYEPVYFESNKEMIKALRNGNADLAVFSAANDFTDGILVSVMDAEPVYFTVKKGNRVLLDHIDQSMQMLLKIDQSLVSEVSRRTMIGDNVSMIAMTREERDFVESQVPVKVGFYEETEPLGYVEKDGNYGGVYVELLLYLKEKTGLNVELVPISRDNNWKDLVKEGEIDFYIGASSVIVSKEDDLSMTDPILSYSNILVTRNDCAFNDLDMPVIALTEARTYWGDYMRNIQGLTFETKYYRSAKECMLAVVSGEVDATILNNLEFNYHSKNERLSSLVQWHQYRFQTDVGLAASNHVDETMFYAVNKAIGMIPSDYVDAVIDESLATPYLSYTFEDRLYIVRVPLAVMAVILLAVTSIIVFFLRFRRRQNRLQKASLEKERQQLQVLAATSYDYSAVYYVNLDENTSVMINHHSGLKGKKNNQDRTVRKYTEALQFFVDRYVMPEFHGSILQYLDKGKILAQFENSPQFSVRYQIHPDERDQIYFEMKFIQVEKNPKGQHMMVLGIRNIDHIIREEQAQRKLLQDALDGANRANEAKTEFFSRMSHDIRTPLNAIVGMTFVAEAHADNPERVKDAMDKISNSSHQLLNLINDVLDMSKIETGKVSLVEENINLSELIGSLLDMTRPLVKKHRHKFNVEIQNIRHEDVIGDSTRIQQVLMNLVSNAVKYTPDEGEISLDIREIVINTPNAACFEFTIRDNGIGMSKEYLKHIFEPFSRAEDLRTSKIQGTGLGMSIIKNIVQMMNGTIKVESELNKGSTFIVTIFLKIQEGENFDSSEFDGLPVLVADDDENAGEVLCDMLEEIGIRPVFCRSGQEAVEEVRRSIRDCEPYYAAMIDWKMPEMDGLETARELAGMTVEGELPVIIFSSFDWSEIEEDAKGAGIRGFLTKPIFRSSLIRLFRKLKNEKSGSADEISMLEKLQESDYSGRKVLLVDDSFLNREIAQELLEMTGLTVEEAEDGQAAVEMFEASEEFYYDLILMDVQMPVMNGHEATRAIRALKRADAGSVPIVALTADAFVEDIHEAIQSGMNDHMAKPVDLDKINMMLEKYLS